MAKYWTDQDNPDKLGLSFAWRFALGTVAVLLFCGLLGWGGWALKVAMSDVKGAGDAAVKINSAENRINSQEWFPGQLAQVQATDAKLDGLHDTMTAAKGTPDEMWARSVYTGTQNRCLEMRENYNAEAQKISREKWVGNSPLRLDDSDPRTDCQITARPTGSPR